MSIDQREGGSRSAARRLLLASACLFVALAASPSLADGVDGGDVAVPAAAASQEPAAGAPAKDDEDWKFVVAPYGWFIFIAGSTSFSDGSGSPVDIRFNEIWEKLHMGLFLDTEVQKGKFGLLTDLLYAYLWERNQILFNTYESKIRLVIFDFALYYEALSLNLGSGPGASRLRLQPFVGGRYVYLSVPTTVRPPGEQLDPTTNTAAPILGLRAFLDFDEHWNMSFHGDGGGFGVDNVDVTWQAELLAGYRWHFDLTDFNLMIGYKGVGLAERDDELDTDFILHGPVLKLGFEF